VTAFVVITANRYDDDALSTEMVGPFATDEDAETFTRRLWHLLIDRGEVAEVVSAATATPPWRWWLEECEVQQDPEDVDPDWLPDWLADWPWPPTPEQEAAFAAERAAVSR
jgi:hypothetical protein